VNIEHNFLTVHSLIALPFHNRNRDDHGMPKQLEEGGATRSYLSSQSRKRPARVNFEASTAGFGIGSMRSKQVADLAVERAIELVDENPSLTLDVPAAHVRAAVTVKSLTQNLSKAEKNAEATALAARAAHLAKHKGQNGSPEEYMAEYDRKLAAKAAAGEAKKDAGAAKDTVVFVSWEEIEIFAWALVNTADDVNPQAVFQNRTGSLSLALSGRMMAAEPRLQILGAVAFSPAVTTHQISTNVDYFTAVDEYDGAKGKAQGAAHLNQAFFTSGVYYASTTYDRRQLRQNWTGWDGKHASELLHEAVRELTLALPQGKKNSTSADTLPDTLIAETQRSRTGFQFDESVQAGPNGGFLAPSVTEMYRQAKQSRLFAPNHFGETVVSGTGAVGQKSRLAGAKVVPMDAMTSFIVNWLRP
jgi:CRISPR system Cascade subunit CasC